jgi:hypothetical protein
LGDRNSDTFSDLVVGCRRCYSPRKPGGRLIILRCEYIFFRNLF